MNSKLMMLAAAALAVLILCAGCILDAPVKTTETEIPVDMYSALNQFSEDSVTLEHAIKYDLMTVSEKMRSADFNEIQEILNEYYSAHPCLMFVTYHSADGQPYISVPVLVEVDLKDYGVLEEEDFKNAGGLIVRDNLFTKYHGYVNAYYKPVYDVHGKYKGYIAFVFDVYSLLYLHPLMLGQEKEYSNYVCFITDENDKIIYSSLEETIGLPLTRDGYYDGLVYVPYVEKGEGACKYTSRGFYNYDEDIQTEKITVWHTLYSSGGQKYTVYLIDELDDSGMKTEDVYNIDTQQALNDITGAYVYANTNSKGNLVERINSGYYETPLYLCDMKGNVVASSESHAVWKNYLNNRGMYGMSYMESAIFAAEQGSKYIYYLNPAEWVINPRAAQYTLGIVMPVDDIYFLFCKTPGSTDAVLKDNNLRPDLTKVSHNVLEEVSLNGVDAVAEVINSNRENAAEIFANGEYTEVDDIAILDVSGNVYASVVRPELVGKSATFMVDAYGGSVTRKSDLVAKTGGGYITQLYENKEKEGYVDLYVALVEPIDSKYYIFAFTLIGTFEDVLTPALENVIPTE